MFFDSLISYKSIYSPIKLNTIFHHVNIYKSNLKCFENSIYIEFSDAC